MRGYRCYIEFDYEDGYVWIEDAESGTLEFIYIRIVDSRDCDLNDVISKSIVVKIE